jgi:hypothetical protein
VSIVCDHPRPKLDLPGYIPRRMAWQVPQNIPGLPPEAARVIRQALQGVYDELSRQGQVRNVIPLVEDLFVRPGSVVVGIATVKPSRCSRPAPRATRTPSPSSSRTCPIR